MLLVGQLITSQWGIDELFGRLHWPPKVNFVLLNLASISIFTNRLSITSAAIRIWRLARLSDLPSDLIWLFVARNAHWPNTALRELHSVACRKGALILAVGVSERFVKCCHEQSISHLEFVLGKFLVRFVVENKLRLCLYTEKSIFKATVYEEFTFNDVI